MGANDFDADTAERYGWINRAMPDGELDAFVANFVARVLSFDQPGAANGQVNHQSHRLAGPNRLAVNPGYFLTNI